MRTRGGLDSLFGCLVLMGIYVSMEAESTEIFIGEATDVT